MPIDGLTTAKDFTLSRALPLLGRIYKGGAKRTRTGQGGKSYEIFGEDLTYFRVEFSPEYQHLQAAWNKIYGAEPDCFTITFMGDTVDEVFPTWYEQHAASTLLHRCDGVTQVRWWDAQARDGMGSYSDQPRACQNTGDAGGSSGSGCKCAKVGNLNFILPDLFEATSQLGFFRLTTHSTHDLIALYNALKLIEKTMGRLTGVPFILGRQTQKVSAPDGKGGRRNLEKSLLYIRVEDTFARNVLQPMLRGAAAPALPAGTPTSAPAANTPELPATFTNGNAIDDEALDGEIIDPAVAPDAAEALTGIWATEAELKRLVNEIQSEYTWVKTSDILKFAGFEVDRQTRFSSVAWDKFASYIAAKSAIVKALRQKEPFPRSRSREDANGSLPDTPTSSVPPTSDAKQDESETDGIVLAYVLTQIKRAFDWSLEDFVKLVGQPPESFTTPRAAWIAAQTVVRKHNLPMIGYSVAWNGQYAELDTDVPLRLYGQNNSSLLLELGAGWPEFVAGWEKGKSYPLPAPVLVLGWSQAANYAQANTIALLNDPQIDTPQTDATGVESPQPDASDNTPPVTDLPTPPEGYIWQTAASLWAGASVLIDGAGYYVKSVLAHEDGTMLVLQGQGYDVPGKTITVPRDLRIAVVHDIPF